MLESENKNKTTLSIVGLIVLLVTMGFSFYFEASSFSTQQQIDDINAQIEVLNRKRAEAATTEGTVSQLELIQQQLTSIEDNQLFWSRIVEKIEKTVPRHGEDGPQIIDLAGYSGGEDGRLVMNAATRGDSSTPFEDIAALITSFTAEPSFVQFFVPSITKSLTPDGATVLNFSANLLYESQQL